MIYCCQLGLVPDLPSGCKQEEEEIRQIRGKDWTGVNGEDDKPKQRDGGNRVEERQVIDANTDQ